MSEIQFLTGRRPMRSYSSWGTRHHCLMEVGEYACRSSCSSIRVVVAGVSVLMCGCSSGCSSILVVVAGVSSALAYSPSIVTVGQYFE